MSRTIAEIGAMQPARSRFVAALQTSASITGCVFTLALTIFCLQERALTKIGLHHVSTCAMVSGFPPTHFTTQMTNP